MEWVEDDQGIKVYWLTGTAGTGKSAICKTVADFLEEKDILGGWIFFRKGDPKCHSCVDLVSSRRWLHDLASQLCSRFKWHKHLSQALIRDPDMTQRGIDHQVRTLIAEPLEQERNRAAAAGEQMQPLIFVIDALDECVDEDVDDMVRLLVDIPGIRLLITARSEVYPEPLQVDSSPKVCDLDRQDQEAVRAEIKSYLTHEIKRYCEVWKKRYSKLTSDWPGEDVISRLADHASPLFIIAVEMLEIIKSRRMGMTHEEKIQYILENSSAFWRRKLIGHASE